MDGTDWFVIIFSLTIVKLKLTAIKNARFFKIPFLGTPIVGRVRFQIFKCSLHACIF